MTPTTPNQYSTSCHTFWSTSWSVFVGVSLIRVFSSSVTIGNGGTLTLSLTNAQKKIHGLRSSDCFTQRWYASI